MVFIFLLLFAVILGVIIGLPIRKRVFKKINLKAEEFLNEKKTTLERELQKFIDTKNGNEKVSIAYTQYTFKYKNNECTCIIVKFKLEGQKSWYLGIVSDSGSYTEFKKFNVMSSVTESYILLEKIYKQPALEINDEYFLYLPKLENIYKINIESSEKVIFNSEIKKFKTDNDITIGVNVKLTMTDKTIYISNGIGIWMIDIHDGISDYKKDDMCVEISLSEICIFGQAGERMCTGYKLYFKNNSDLDKFDQIMSNIIK